MPLYFHEDNPDGVLQRRVDEVLCLKKTAVQTVTIIRQEPLGRILYLDDCHQADDLFEDFYHEKMVSLVPEEILKSGEAGIAGFGPGGLAKTLLNAGVPHVTGCELDIDAYELYRKYLPDWGGDLNKVSLMFGDATRYDWSKLQLSSFFWDIDSNCIDPKSTLWFSIRFALGDIHRSLSSGKGYFVAAAGSSLVLSETNSYKTFRKLIEEVFPGGVYRDWPEMYFSFYAARVL